MTKDQQLAEWQRIADMADCVTDNRLCQEDIRAMMKRIRAAEDVLHQIAGAHARGSLVTVTQRLTAIIDKARQVVS